MFHSTTINKQLFKGLYAIAFFVLITSMLCSYVAIEYQTSLSTISSELWPNADSAMELQIAYLKKIQAIENFVNNNTLQAKYLATALDERINKEIGQLKQRINNEHQSIKKIEAYITQLNQLQIRLFTTKEALEAAEYNVNHFMKKTFQLLFIIHKQYDNSNISLQLDELIDKIQSIIALLSNKNTTHDGDLLKSIQQTNTDIRQHQGYNAIKQHYQHYWDNVSQFLQHHQQWKEKHKQQHDLLTDLYVVNEKLKRVLEKLETKTRIKMENFSQQGIQKANNILIISLICLFISIIASFIIARHTGRSIINSIQELMQSIQSYSEAKQLVTITANHLTFNELAQLTQSFNEMMQLIYTKNQSLTKLKDNLQIEVDKQTLALTNTNQQLLNEIQVKNEIQEQLIISKKQAEKSSESKSEFLARMSHELRTPMNAILGFGQVLEVVEKDPKKLDQIKTIIRAGEHLLLLINEVLDIVNVDSGHMILSLEEIKLSRMFDECMIMTKPLAEQKNITLKVTRNDDLWVKADNLRLIQVITNLLSNAIKYNHHDSVIKIEAEAIKNNNIKISIIDTGFGIEKEEQHLIFDPFQRMHSKIMKIEGIGIGLTITKKLIGLMNGKINFVSEPNKGSTFWIELPQGAAQHYPNDENTIKLLNDQHMNKASYSVLYIDDNPESLKLMETILGKYNNCQLLMAHTAEIGLELAKQYQPNLIILDINLPGMNGFEALEKLKNNPKTASCVIIALSANALPNEIKKGLDLGFSEYLVKPLNIKRFLETINNLIKPEQIQQKPTSSS